MPALQKYLRAEIEQRAWSMDEFARRAQLSLSNAYLIVRDGKDNVRQNTFDNIAAALSMTSAELWLTLKGNRLSPSELRRTLGNLCQDAGINGNRPPHAFRRAYFTEQYRDQPTALPILVERMGWETDQMAKVYTRGVDIELARRIALPLQSKKWRARR